MGFCGVKPQRWSGHLVVDDYVGYKALFTPEPGVAKDESDAPSIIEVLGACQKKVL